jgi:hypothetical protein
MSSISAGITTGTALVSTGDTTGNLDLKINGSTQAVRVNTSGAIGVGTSPAFGTSGQVLTSGGSSAAPTWTTPAPSIGGGGTTATNNVTLTSSSAADQYVTPSAHGFYVKLPDATTLSEGSGLYNIHNNSNFFYGIENNAGTTLCFVPPYSSVTCSLADNGTSNGTWNFVNQEQLGVAAQTIVTIPSSTSSALRELKVVNLDSQYQVILFNTSAAVYAVAYDNVNNTFGSVVLVRTATLSSNAILPVKVSSTSLLVASCSSTTAFEAVLLSVSGTTITVNTAATATLGGNLVGFRDVQVVGSSYIFLYARATSVVAVRALTISGAAVTIGSESTLTGTATSNIFKTSSSTFLAVSWGSGTAYVTPYTVSGTTLTAGTQATTAAVDYQPRGMYINSNNNLMFYVYTGGFWKGCVASVSGTTASISTVNLAAQGTTASTFGNVAGAFYTGNQVLYCFYSTANIGVQYAVGFNVLTDSAGTAVAGTANVTQQTGAASSNPVAFMSGFDATSMYITAWISGDSGSFQTYITAGISGNDPIISSTLYYQWATLMNVAYGNAPEISANTQRTSEAVSSVGNPSKGDFISFEPYQDNINNANTVCVRMNKNSISTQALKSLGSSLAASATTGGSASTNCNISNTFSDSTTLNQFGESWGIAVVQAVAVGGFSYSKVVLTRLVYA